MIKAIKNCIKNSDYTESEKTQMLAWIECAIDFGKNLDEVAKENEQIQQKWLESEYEKSELVSQIENAKKEYEQLKQKLDWFLTETIAGKEYRPKEELEELQRENEQLKAQIETKRKKLFDILTEYEIGNYDVNIHQFYKDVYDIHNELMELAE